MNSLTTPNRRHFVKSAAAAGTGLLILPSGTLFGQNRPGNKLNIALIGCWGRATAHRNMLHNENVVALCDINEKALAAAGKEFPGAKRYKDWRKCLDQKDIDAVVCCTPDHHHAFISIWAMNRGLHVYGEKPLANSVEEARIVRSTYLKNKNKLATQCGTQRHFGSNFARTRELVKGGAIGDLKSVHAWGNRTHNITGYQPESGSAPDFIDWDLWVGPSPMHPFNPAYFTAEKRNNVVSYFDSDSKNWPTGSNCLSWNMYRDFGNWQIGDMGSHTMDLAFNPLDADYPISAQGEGDPFNKDIAPSMMNSTCINPANDWRGNISVTWHQGGSMPKSPLSALDLNKIGHGALFKGSQGFLVCDFTTRMVIPYGPKANMSYYEPAKDAVEKSNITDFGHEWTNACKTNLKTSCNFDYSGVMIEQLLLGLVAYDVGKKLDYDPKKMYVRNSPEANQRLRKEYRKGWVLNG
ncbi:MAG: Gfo/Idh/MocA family protein [Opitutales bacterium]